MKPNNIKVSDIIPADYNPRRIDDDEFDELCKSVSRLGVIIPVIVNKKNNVIIAGHQRVKACKALGIAEVPYFYAENVSQSDEVVFNQIHNGTDADKGIIGKMEPFSETGWCTCDADSNHCDCKSKVIVAEVAKLIQRYGNVLSCVALPDGEVVSCVAYASACRMMNISANVYVIDHRDAEFAKHALSSSYGKFDYSFLKKNTWVQGLAQLVRHRDKREVLRGHARTKARTKRSVLYEKLVLPNVDHEIRMLDFGCGYGDYVKELSGMGYDILGLEWYNNNRSSINVSKGERQAEAVLKSIAENGLFDVVICDSVLNSVDCIEAEHAVMGTLNALLKTGGTLFVSGRRVESVKRRLNRKQVLNAAEYSYFAFLDENNFTATFRNGNFFYQHFHDEEQIRSLIANYGFECVQSYNNSGGWYRMLRKIDDVPNWQECVRYEFSLPYPGGRYCFADKAVETICQSI